MYGFEPTEEQKMLIAAAEKFAANDLRGSAHEADETGAFPEAVVRRGWELGLLQASIPESLGGFGERSAVTGVLAAEALAWGDLAGAITVMAPGIYAMPILIAGSEQQRARLAAIADGDWAAFTSAMAEPDIDFYPGELRSTAERHNGGYRLNGLKTMVPFADRAQSLLVYAAVDGRTQAFLVEPSAEGLSVGEREKHLGLGGLPLFPLRLEQVEVPAEARLGGADGCDPEPLLSSTRVAVAALGVGVARAAYEYALAYAKDRQVFGVPIAQKQTIAFMLAEMAIEIEAIRLLVWEAAWTLDQGKQATRESVLALTGAGDLAMMATDRSVQILGGHGYIREHPVERWYRTGRGLPVFPGLAMV